MYENDVWIAEQFGAADLGDARRSRRAAQLALSLLRAPGVGLPEQTKTWGGCKAAYRLLHCPEVTRIKLMQPHFDMTLASANKPGVTLFAQDTTELDYTHMVHAQGYGPIGNHKGAGLMVHSLLALTPQGDIIGLAAQHSWARSNGPTQKNNETSAQRRLRDGKESEVWPKLLESVGAVPPSKVWVSIGDRGSDSFDYWRRATALGWQCLSRIFTNRRTADNSHLITKARALPLQG